MVLRDPVGIAYMAAAAVFAVVAVVTWRRRAQSPTIAAALTMVMVGACWWSVSLAVKVTATHETVAAIAKIANFPGASSMVAAFVCLGLAIARPQWAPRRWVVAALFVEPVLVTVAAATNPRHLLVYRGAGAAQLTGSAGWTNGPVFWLDTWYGYLAMAVGIGLIAWSWWKASPAFRGQRLTLLLAALVPVVANAVYVAGGLGSVIDPTPLVLAVAGTVMFYAIFRQHLFTFSPVARALIIDQIGDAIVVISPAGRVLDLNPAAVDLLRGINPNAPTDVVGASAQEVFGDGLIATIDSRETELAVELAGVRAEFQVRASLLVDRHHRGRGSVFVARDVTEANNQSRRLAAAHSQLVRQVETIERLRVDLAELASRDPLTGLHNRRHMVEGFASMIAAAERSGEPLAVALFDVDRFKAVNDDYGHLAGDAVLVGLAQLMSERSPAGALVARWGGEEFFVALPGADAATGLAFADDLRRRCELNAIVVEGRMIRCTLSGGVAAYPASGTTMDELFHAVDVSMYEAKNAGRNLVRLHLGRAPSTAVDAEVL
jgi:diguanylate cyclase (GGDEF)-like protein